MCPADGNSMQTVTTQIGLTHVRNAHATCDSTDVWNGSSAGTDGKVVKMNGGEWEIINQSKFIVRVITKNY